MDEGTHRKWDIVFKWLGLSGVLLSAWWTVHTYQHTREVELQQQKYTQEKDNEARTKEQNSFIFQHQATLYFDASKTAATLAAANAPNSSYRNNISKKAAEEALQRFEQLYWGEMVVVEDRRVELAMISFRNCLLHKGVDCSRLPNNQNGKPISQDLIEKLLEPTLLNLSLELAACTRTALQEDRKIQFGSVQEAITRCPYD